MRLRLRAELSARGSRISFEAPPAYLRLNGRVSVGGSEAWISLEGNSLTIDIRRLGGRVLLRPAEALRDLRDLAEAARGLAEAGYAVNIRIRGIKILTMGRAPRASGQQALPLQHPAGREDPCRGRAVYPTREPNAIARGVDAL
ncbi:MAG: hypothetical protein RXR82_07410 [Nitrososphaeria archaeon]